MKYWLCSVDADETSASNLFIKRIIHNVRRRTFRHMCLTKTPISLRIRVVWSESSLAVFSNFALLAIPTPPSEDSDETVRMDRLIGIFAGRIHLRRYVFWRCGSDIFETMALYSLSNDFSYIQLLLPIYSSIHLTCQDKCCRIKSSLFFCNWYKHAIHILSITNCHKYSYNNFT